MSHRRDCQADFYASCAAIRRRDRRIGRAKKIIRVLQQYLLQDLSQSVCVDVGCSAGVITAQLAPMFGMIVGIDYDPTGLAAIGPQDKAKASFVRSDASCLPLAGGSVDVVICAQVYEHVPDDVALVEEIRRILSPGGYCFFSGPNWLFPVEPHYFLPFLHWLPGPLANRYLRLARLGTRYHERSRTIWGLRRLWGQFEIADITIEVLRYYLVEQSRPARLLRFMPLFIWKLLLPLFPNFNWVLRKPIL